MILIPLRDVELKEEETSSKNADKMSSVLKSEDSHKVRPVNPNKRGSFLLLFNAEGAQSSAPSNRPKKSGFRGKAW